MNLLQFTSMTGVDGRALMDIYHEGNVENGAYFFPELSPEQQIRKAEAEFLKYLETDFFRSPGSRMYVLEDGGQWAACLRLEDQGDYWWLEALETRPDLRRRGYGTALLRAVAEDLGAGIIRDAVSRKNEPSLHTHRAAGFFVERNPAVEPDGETDPRCLGLRLDIP